jgi:hypothetical protein
MRILLTIFLFGWHFGLGHTQTAQERVWLRKVHYYADTFHQKWVYPMQKPWLPIAFEQKMAHLGNTKSLHYCKLLEKADPKYLLTASVQSDVTDMNKRLGLEFENRAIYERFLNTPDSLFPSKADLILKQMAMKNLGYWLFRQEKKKLIVQKPKLIWSFNRKKYFGYQYGNIEYTSDMVRGILEDEIRRCQLLAANGYLDGALNLLADEMYDCKSREMERIELYFRRTPVTELLPPAFTDPIYSAAWKTYAQLWIQKYGKTAVQQLLNTALKDSISLSRPDCEGFITLFNRKWSLGKLQGVSMEKGLLVPQRLRVIRGESDAELIADFANAFKYSYLYLAVNQE